MTKSEYKFAVHFSKKYGYRILRIEDVRINMKNILNTFKTRRDASKWIALQYLLNA